MNTAEVSKAATCIEACLDAAIAADRCGHACLHEAEVARMVACINLTQDCAQLCRTTAFLISHGSRFARQTCEVCAQACEACAEECERHSRPHCNACAQSCRAAAEECRRYARH